MGLIKLRMLQINIVYSTILYFSRKHRKRLAAQNHTDLLRSKFSETYYQIRGYRIAGLKMFHRSEPCCSKLKDRAMLKWSGCCIFKKICNGGNPARCILESYHFLHPFLTMCAFRKSHKSKFIFSRIIWFSWQR